MKRFLREEMRTAYRLAGWRERYAMENGNRATIYQNGEKCYKFTYSTAKEYQDANGATYNTARKAQHITRRARRGRIKGGAI